MKRAVLYFGLIALGFISGVRWSYASEPIMARVERALVEAGYTKALGYSKLPPPVVEVNEFIAGNGWGSYRLGRIELSSRQPAGCMVVTLVHELAHDAAVRMGLLDGVENSRVFEVLERVSAAAEAAIDADDYRPNCVMRRLP